MRKIFWFAKYCQVYKTCRNFIKFFNYLWVILNTNPLSFQMIPQIESLSPNKILIGLVIILICYFNFRPPWWKKNDKKTKSIPGPTAIPLIGTNWLFYFGCYNIYKIKDFYNAMYKKYGPIVKQESFFNYHIYNVFEKKDIEKVLKAPSKYPLRPSSEAAIIYRASRPDRYASVGITHAQGNYFLHTNRNMSKPFAFQEKHGTISGQR